MQENQDLRPIFKSLYIFRLHACFAISVRKVATDISILYHSALFRNSLCTVTSKSRISMIARCSDARWWMHQRDQSTGIYHSRSKAERNGRWLCNLDYAEGKREKLASKTERKSKTARRLDPAGWVGRWDWIWQTSDAKE